MKLEALPVTGPKVGQEVFVTAVDVGTQPFIVRVNYPVKRSSLIALWGDDEMSSVPWDFLFAAVSMERC